MPQPSWMNADYDPQENPSTHLELVGRGRKARATKTWIPDIEGATILQRIGNMAPDVAGILRELHARHYTRTVSTKKEDGTVVITQEPEYLSYDELKAKYDCLSAWEEAYQKQLELLGSHKGFLTIRATGGNTEAPKTKEGREASSAGSEGGKTRWQ